mmetsp:Transcript_41287/g.129324  ORF Transcript_41287/g.129324 Transcript_41287/m.129324 type:complete len:401 (+) Transcript_41287:4131-5333(+)
MGRHRGHRPRADAVDAQLQRVAGGRRHEEAAHAAAHVLGAYGGEALVVRVLLADRGVREVGGLAARQRGLHVHAPGHALDEVAALRKDAHVHGGREQRHRARRLLPLGAVDDGHRYRRRAVLVVFLRRRFRQVKGQRGPALRVERRPGLRVSLRVSLLAGPAVDGLAVHHRCDHRGGAAGRLTGRSPAAQLDAHEVTGLIALTLELHVQEELRLHVGAHVDLAPRAGDARGLGHPGQRLNLHRKGATAGVPWHVPVERCDGILGGCSGGRGFVRFVRFVRFGLGLGRRAFKRLKGLQDKSTHLQRRTMEVAIRIGRGYAHGVHGAVARIEDLHVGDIAPRVVVMDRRVEHHLPHVDVARCGHSPVLPLLPLLPRLRRRRRHMSEVTGPARERVEEDDAAV